MNGCDSQVRAGPFSQVTKNKTSGIDLKLQQERFGLNKRKYFFMEKVVKHCNRLPREMAVTVPDGI